MFQVIPTMNGELLSIEIQYSFPGKDSVYTVKCENQPVNQAYMFWIKHAWNYSQVLMDVLHENSLDISKAIQANPYFKTDENWKRTFLQFKELRKTLNRLELNPFAGIRQMHAFNFLGLIPKHPVSNSNILESVANELKDLTKKLINTSKKINA